MNETRDLLERIGERFPFPDEAFDRMVRRRDRKQRNKRIGAGLVAAVLMAIVAVGTIRTLQHEPLQVPASEPNKWVRVKPSDPAIFGNAEILAVTRGGPGFVAVGDNPGNHFSRPVPSVWLSSDGLTWSRLTIAGGSLEGIPATAILYGVAAGGPGLVATGIGPGNKPAAWFSSDGRTWTLARVSLPEPIGHDFDHMGGIFPTDFGFIAAGSIGSDGYVWTSTDGRVWEAIPDEAVFGGRGQQEIGAIIPGGPGYVVVGVERPDDTTIMGAEVVWTSSDGRRWTRQTPVGVGLAARGQIEIGPVFAGGPGFVAFGMAFDARGQVGGPAAWTSPDGITWKRVKGQSEPLIQAVVRTKDGFVGAGYGGVWTSKDGVTWAPDPRGPTGSDLLGLVSDSDSGRLIAVGSSLDGSQGEIWIKESGR